MKIKWNDGPDGDLELWLGDVNMGWVDNENYVHCMWMSYTDDLFVDVRVVEGRLIESQYPEDCKFETPERAQAALLESAVPMYIGGFRGR